MCIDFYLFSVCLKFKSTLEVLDELFFFFVILFIFDNCNLMQSTTKKKHYANCFLCSFALTYANNVKIIIFSDNVYLFVKNNFSFNDKGE